MVKIPIPQREPIFNKEESQFVCWCGSAERTAWLERTDVVWLCSACNMRLFMWKQMDAPIIIPFQINSFLTRTWHDLDQVRPRYSWLWPV